MSRVTDAEVEMRVREILDLLLLGSTRAEILRYCTNRGWGVQSRQIDIYMAQAKEEIHEISRVTATETMSLILKNLWYLYKKCLDKDDLGGARTALMDIAKLKGMAQETVTHLIHRPKEDLIELDDDAFDAMAARQH